MQEGQHPLALNNSPSLPPFLSVEENDTIKKSPNSRRRRRGSRRRSSAVESSTERRKSAVITEEEEEKDSPAFQSIVDIIHQMKRLPSISITTDKQEPEEKWKRVRRHSEPQHKLKHGELKKSLNSIHEKPIFSNSFLLLEEEEGENVEKLVSPLQTGRLSPPKKRSRSSSVPNTVLPQQQQHHQQQPETIRRPLYPTHLPVCEASAAVRDRTLFSGILRVDSQDSSEANVECEELDGDSIYIFGSRNRNRALDGDEVAVELVDVDEMMNEKQQKRQARHTRRLSSMSIHAGSPQSLQTGLSSIPEFTFLENFNLSSNKPRPKYCGKVVSILERPKNMLFSGTLSLYRPHAKTLDNGSRDKKETHSPKIIWFIPADKRLPLVAVAIKHAPANFVKYHEEYKNRIFAGNIQRWPATSLHPFGIIEKEIGWMGELGVHSGALMADHHIKDMEFSGVVKKAAAAIPAELSGSDKKGRRDLTKEDIKIFTIGESNEDLDNAFSITNTEKGIYEIGIHVTDVSHFIRENTPLEREARERSCAVQLVDKMIAILPTSFTESHCSLGVTNKDRLAFSVLCRFTENGVLLHAWLGKTIIQSFGHVQLPLNDTKNPFHSDAKTILKICQRLQSNRLLKLQGASLAKSIEIFQLGESGYPEQVERINQTDKDVLLQELLIVANIEVAQKICSRFPDQALLYRQDDPKMSKLTAIQDYFENEPLTSSVNGLVKLIKEKERSTDKQETLLHVIRQSTPTSKYFSAGSLDISKYRHSGFGASICTMFTEPIHNYASIHVQKQLSLALKGEEQENDNFDPIDKIARHCNSSQLAKLSAEEESKKLYTAAYIYRQCLNTVSKNMLVEAFAVQFDTDIIHLYIPEYDVEIPVIMNDTFLKGGHHDYNSTLYEMSITWDKEKEEKLTLKFLSSIDIRIHVDMTAVRPILEIEILK